MGSGIDQIGPPTLWTRPGSGPDTPSVGRTWTLANSRGGVENDRWTAVGVAGLRRALFRFRSRAGPAVVGGGQLPDGRRRSTCRTTRCCASRCAPEHIKPRLLGHWGTCPGLTLDLRPPQPARSAETDADVIYLAGPGHGGPALVATRLPRGHVLGDLPATCRADAAGSAPAVPPVLDARRHPEPRAACRRPGRSTRAASSATRSSHAVRRGVRQPRPDRRRA